MKINLYGVYLFVIFILLMGCEKEKFTPPSIQTLSARAETINKITVVGNILEVGSENVEDYGFVYNFSQQIDELNGIKVSLGNAPQRGQFTKEIDIVNTGQNNYNNTIYIRAYLRDSKGTAFGAMISIGLPTPSTSTVIPSSAMSGDVVKILGKFHNPSLLNTVVTFQSVHAKVLAVSDTEIAVEVPSGIPVSHGYNVTPIVTVSGISTSGYSNSSLRMLANIKDFQPKSGPIGTLITFSGDNLNNSYSSVSPIMTQIGDVVFNNVGNSINVPFNVQVASKLSFTVNGQKKDLPGVFTVSTPQILSLTPESVLPGQNITISGSNFPLISYYVNERGMIKIGSSGYQNLAQNSSTQFTYTVPASMTEGDHTVYIKIGPHEVSAPKTLKVTGYNAISFTPSSGGPGREVNITGNFVSGTYYTVLFGAYRTNGTATSATNLRVIVPTGINIGKVKLGMEFPGKTITIPGDFEIIGPSFDSFSPASGVPGSIITIKGSGFNPSNSATVVKFGSVIVNPVSVTDNTITVAVPSNVAIGAMKLSVVSNGQTVTHADNFTILN